VIVGSKGLTESVVKEVDVALRSHELIKVKLASDDRGERERHVAALSEAVGAATVQQIGKILVLYREKLEAPAVPSRPAPKAVTRKRPVSSGEGRRRTAAAPTSHRPRRDTKRPVSKTPGVPARRPPSRAPRTKA
jgi:RNA-binding protein